jgi:hypothetical protein
MNRQFSVNPEYQYDSAPAVDICLDQQTWASEPVIYQNSRSERAEDAIAGPIQQPADSKTLHNEEHNPIDSSWRYQRGEVVILDGSASDDNAEDCQIIGEKRWIKPRASKSTRKLRASPGPGSTVSDRDSAIDVCSVRATPPPPRNVSPKEYMANTSQLRRDKPRKSFSCPSCPRVFIRDDSLRCHERKAHKKLTPREPPRIKDANHSKLEKGKDNVGPMCSWDTTTYTPTENKTAPYSSTPCNSGSELNDIVFFQSPASQFSDMPDPLVPPRGQSPFNACGTIQNLEDFGVDFVPDWRQESANQLTGFSDDLNHRTMNPFPSTPKIGTFGGREKIYPPDRPLQHIELFPRPAPHGRIHLFPPDPALWLSTVETDRFVIPGADSLASASSSPSGCSHVSPEAFSTTPTTPDSGSEHVEDRINNICPEGNFYQNPLLEDMQPIEYCEDSTEQCAFEGEPFAELCEHQAPLPINYIHDTLTFNESSGGSICCDQAPTALEARNSQSKPVARSTPSEPIEKEDNNNFPSQETPERRPSFSTVASSMSSDSTPTKTDTFTAISTPQTSPAPSPESRQRIGLPHNVYSVSSSNARVWLHRLLPWIREHFRNIMGQQNPGAIEYLVMGPRRVPTVHVTARNTIEVDQSFLEDGIRSICDNCAREDGVVVNFEVKVGQGKVRRTGDHDLPGEWPANNGRFQPVPSCGACIGMGDCTTASLGGLVELKINNEWKVFGLTSHHLLEQKVEGVKGDGVNNGFLRDRMVEETTQPSRQYQKYKVDLLNRELMTNDLFDKSYKSLNLPPAVMENNLKRREIILDDLKQQEVETSFGRIIYSSGFDRMTDKGQTLDYALIGDINPERLNVANFVDRPPEHCRYGSADPITDIVNEHYFEIITTLGYTERAEPDTTPPEPVCRVHGVGAATGEQDGYLSPMPFAVNFEGFGEASTEWSFAPHTPNGLGKSLSSVTGTTKLQATDNIKIGKSGDSGAWIFDSFGCVMGMILGHNDDTNITYFTPMHFIFKDIKALTGATDVRLPLPRQTIPPAARQSHELRGACGGTSSMPDKTRGEPEIVVSDIGGREAGPWCAYSSRSYSSLKPDGYFTSQSMRTPGDGTPNSQRDSAIDFPLTPSPIEKRKLPLESGEERSPKRTHQVRDDCSPCDSVEEEEPED